MKLVDAHHHLWDLSQGHYPWLQEGYDPKAFFLGDYSPICRDFLASDYQAAARPCEVVATVHVEAERSRREQVAETAWLHEVHAVHGFPNAVVAHAWFDQPDSEECLLAQSRFPLVRGIRSKPVTSASPAHSVKGQAGTMQDEAWLRGFALLEKYGLRWDLRVPAWHLPEAAAVAAQFPKVPIVLNHHGFAWDRSEEGLQRWRGWMQTLARQENVHVKLSEFGLRDQPWNQHENARIVHETIAIFGWQRCMFASNFPVAGLRISYPDLVGSVAAMLAHLPPGQQHAMMCDNALRFYAIDVTPPVNPPRPARPPAAPESSSTPGTPPMTTTTKHDNLIAGQWTAGSSYSPNLNPSNLADVIGEYTQADAAGLDAAVQAAQAAFPAWSTSGIQARSDALDKIGTEILARREELGTLLSREEGKTKPEGIGEATRAGHIFKFFAGECLRLGGETMPSVRPGIGVEITREPVGVVGLITPWNFPIAIPAWKIAPALAFGNCVVLKPADLVPGSAWALAEIISRSGIPAGVFNLVMGPGRVIGDALVNHPGVNAISFTGSVGVGGRIAEACAKNLKKVQLEMGGKNPQIILDDADLTQAVELSAQSAFYSTGQRCTASSRLIVTDRIYPAFIEALQARMARIKVGDALTAGTDVGPVSSQAQLEQDLSYIEIGKAEGAKLAFGGARIPCHTGSGAEGYFMQPALFTESEAGMRINREEIFGPVASIIRVKDYEAALATANDTPFGLSAGIATSSLKYATHFKRHSQAGMVMVNLPTAGVDYHVPFGGRKGSSYGPREQGKYAQEFFTTVKTAYTLA